MNHLPWELRNRGSRKMPSMLGLLLGASILGRNGDSCYPATSETRKSDTNPLSGFARERIATEAIAKADARRLRRLQRKQADRERPKYKEPPIGGGYGNAGRD